MVETFEQATTASDTPPEWKQRAAAKRAAQFSRIPPKWQIPPTTPKPRSALHYLRTSDILTPEELTITEIHDARALLDQIAIGRYSASQVLRAYCKRAAIAQQLVQCCTEILFEEALQRAEALDRHFLETGQLAGPLHGLPVSLKDIFDVEGHDSTIGWVGLIDKPAEANCLATDILISLGAIPFVKTNVAQALMLSDSYNHVFKQCVNSLNRDLISGGSSGGESALIGCNASILGMGTDTGGSIRIPASLQGLYGLCCTAGRIPFDESKKWQLIAPPVAGPLARDLSTIELFMDSFLSAKPWNFDPSLIPLPWRTELAELPMRPLRIGYYVDDGVVRVQPPIAKAVTEVVRAFKNAGHEVVEWNTATHLEAFKLWTKATFADGGQEPKRLSQLGGEPLIEGVLVGTEADQLSLEECKEVSGYRRFLTMVWHWGPFMRMWSGEKNDAFSKHLQIAALRLEYQQLYQKRWRESGIDVLITPVQPYVGLKPRTWAISHQYIGYTAHWNWLGYPALAVPASKAQQEPKGGLNPIYHEGTRWEDHVPRNQSDHFNWKQFDPSLVQDMPVGVQIVGERFGEEKCIAVAKIMRDLINIS